MKWPRVVEKVQVEVRGEVLPEAHRLIVKRHTFRRQVVGADDRGVAAGVASADIAFFQYGYVAYPMVFCKIVSGR